MSNPNDRPLTFGEFRDIVEQARRFAEILAHNKDAPLEVDRERGDRATYTLGVLVRACKAATLPPPVEAAGGYCNEPGHGAFCGTFCEKCVRSQPSPQPGAPKPRCLGREYCMGSCAEHSLAPRVAVEGAPKGLVPFLWVAKQRKTGNWLAFTENCHEDLCPVALLSDCNAALAEKDAEMARYKAECPEAERMVAAAERARIVLTVKSRAGLYSSPTVRDCILALADAIERGESGKGGA